MISSGVVERPGAWRGAGVIGGLLLAVAPAFPLLWVLGAEGAPAELGAGFSRALGRGLEIALYTAAFSLLTGLPAGTLAGLYRFPLRRPLLAALAVPLVVPSFLWAIGLSMFRIALGWPPESLLSGRPGCVIAFAAFGFPLVLYATFSAVRAIPASQVEAARLAGGERAVVRYAAGSAFPVAAVAAMLAGVLTLADPGPGQILSYPGVATEILTSFSALYDFALATRQCTALAAVVLLLAAPVAWLAAPRLATGLLAINTRPAPLARRGFTSWVSPVLLLGMLALTTAMPAAGLLGPLAVRFPLSRAFGEAARTIPNTVFYAAVAGVAASLLGCLLALCAGREKRWRTVLLAGLVVVLSLPPALGALGVIQAASLAPAWLDPLLRGRFLVAVVLALRLSPVATVIAMRRAGSFAPSWAWAAAVHSVPLAVYLRRVVGPLLLPAAALGALLTALLATADVGTVLLLQPPGEASLPVTIFTVMANAPEALVASLCLLYIAGAVTLLMVAWLLVGRATFSFGGEEA